MGDEVNVTEWVECINDLSWSKGVEFYKIQEEFKSIEKKVYLVRGFGVVEENSLCVCYDFDDVLISNSSAISGFLTNSVKIYKKDVFTFNLLFKNGNVCITKINDYS
jgi:hypothetical protein